MLNQGASSRRYIFSILAYVLNKSGIPKEFVMLKDKNKTIYITSLLETEGKVISYSKKLISPNKINISVLI